VAEDVIRSENSGNIRSNRKIAWSDREGRVDAALEERIGAVLLSRRPFTPSDEETVTILCDVIRRVPGALQFSGEVKQFQARVTMIRNVYPEETWPDVSEAFLISRPEEWLVPWLGGIRSGEALRGLHLLPAVKNRLGREQLRVLDERAPVALTVPSGSRAALDYVSGDQPVLAVKLQEMFGLADTPTIAGGRIKIVLHLLSPARRPVQITQDLRGFWNTGYPLVKKDLKGRYPKHPWPDDPWKAAPTKRTKPR
jgi:ATP-dependent helicase HrpB